MKINRHNLEIFKYCAPEPQVDQSGVTRITNTLKLTGSHTVVTNNHFMVQVSAIEASEPEKTYLSKPNVEILKTLGGDEPFDPAPMIYETVQGEGWNEEYVIAPTEKTPPVLEMFLDASYLLQMAQAAIDFGSRGVRVQFFGPQQPIRLDARRPDDDQTLSIFLASLQPSGEYAKRFN